MVSINLIVGSDHQNRGGKEQGFCSQRLFHMFLLNRGNEAQNTTIRSKLKPKEYY